MFLVVGLGNPGKKYESTRHNLGFKVVDEIAATFQFSIFNFHSIFNAQISKGKINGKKIILAKPQTFMNLSGKSVKPLINFYKITLPDLVVIHDDIDLSLGKIKIVKNRGAAGHKGVESIIKELKTKDFVRFRIGILPKTGKPKNPEKFVLEKFNKEEEKILKKVIKKTVEAIEMATRTEIEKTIG
ncbi:MAG: aminoacyl-tRNA hydrolase [Patescibacteria group bacterium]|nr:aminoacyl-tRNA hydrolase [Patescibacteria group bacterium]